MPTDDAGVRLDAPDPTSNSFATTPSARRRMQRQPVRDTAPELALRRELHRRGLRYRLEQSIVPGTRRRVDVVFGPTKVAVFVDGCFWHGCPEHVARVPKVNSWYWNEKLLRNRARDQDSDARLRSAGWVVVRVWEHEDMVRRASDIDALVRSLRQCPSSGGSPSRSTRRSLSQTASQA
ncbi:MAG: very short patch repair endonuclease [Acidimicrobiales bacterium]